MSQIDARAQNTVLRMVEKYGRTITYVRRAAGTYNTDISSSAPTETTCTPKAYVAQPSSEQIKNGMLASSQVAYIPGKNLAVQPTPGDRITDGGMQYTVGIRNRLTVGSLDVLWIVEMKR